MHSSSTLEGYFKSWFTYRNKWYLCFIQTKIHQQEVVYIPEARFTCHQAVFCSRIL